MAYTPQVGGGPPPPGTNPPPIVFSNGYTVQDQSTNIQPSYPSPNPTGYAAPPPEATVQQQPVAGIPVYPSYAQPGQSYPSPYGTAANHAPQYQPKEEFGIWVAMGFFLGCCALMCARTTNGRYAVAVGMGLQLFAIGALLLYIGLRDDHDVDMGLVGFGVALIVLGLCICFAFYRAAQRFRRSEEESRRGGMYSTS